MERVLIVDFGSQYTQLIARAVRRIGVYCEICPPDVDGDFLQNFAAAAYILSGGPQSVNDKNAPRIAAPILAAGVPVLGLCYGMQALAAQLGGEVARGEAREYGAATAHWRAGSCPLARGLPAAMPVWMSHGDHVARPPAGFEVAATGDGGKIAAIWHKQKRLFGLQFHPEVAHTPDGGRALANFLRDICGLSCSWNMPNFIGPACERAREATGADGVLLALSGGVDSAVCAALLRRALGGRLHCLLVDNGLLRAGEADEVRALFSGEFGEQLHIANAQERFFAALRGATDPEEKRRRIGRVFVETLEAHARELGSNVRWLAQGTIYPDVVESAQTGAGKAVIKTHHNVGGLPERLNLRLLEPLRELFKDEVRALGEALGLSRNFVWRHPFPGPGLAVRVLGEVSAERAEVARRADKIFLEELRAAGFYDKTAQAFAVLLPVCSVGVMGDARTYENAIALRAVVTEDFMTADWARLPPELLARASARIINEVAGVNRVVYDISSKPPATVEWE